jgi:hypothetical protein
MNLRHPREKTFLEILEESLHAYEEEIPTPQHHSFEQTLETPYWAIEYKTSQSTFRRTAAYRQHRPMKPPQTATPILAAPPASAPERSFKVNELSAVGLAAFKLLGLSPEKPLFTLSEVKKQFRKRALKLHPDHNPHIDEDEFVAIKEAMDALKRELKHLKATI